MAPNGQWAQAIWSAVQTDISCYVLITGEEGEIVCANASAERWLQLNSEAGRTPSIFSALPRAVAGEWNSYVHEALTSGKVVVVDGLIRGEGLRGTVRPLPPSPSQRKAALLVFQRLCEVAGRQQPGIAGPRRIARHNDLGQLERLTPRELQVLMLIASGLSSNEIAESLHRSRRTIDCHRASIGHKLDLSSRADVALIAMRAGLVRNHGPAPSAEHGAEDRFADPLVKVVIGAKAPAGRRASSRTARN